MSRALRTLGATAALVLVAGLLGTGTASAGVETPDPLAGAPVVGACYDLTLKQAYGRASPETPVDCAGRHTMVVTAVGQLPASLDWSTIEEDTVPRPLSRTLDTICEPAAAKLVGPARLRSMTVYQDYFFAPTAADVTAGARWFSCLVALTETRSLIPFPKGQPAKIGSRIPDSIGRCATSSKGGFRTVACSRPHKWRTTYTKLVPGKRTEKRALKAARRTCPRHVSSPNWLYFSDWVNSRTFVVGCSDKTRR